MILLALLAAAEGRTTAGVYHRWAAFADAAPRRCYAISRPVTRGPGFASVGFWPATHARAQFSARLGHAPAPSARVTLSVGERRFALVAREAIAWAPDTATDRAVIAAMRAGRSMSVETTDRAGRPFADVYALSGAASAIDAAALACVRR